MYIFSTVNCTSTSGKGELTLSNKTYLFGQQCLSLKLTNFLFEIA